jgi:hypothetical protein
MQAKTLVQTTTALLLLTSVGLSSPAHAEADWFNSLYTPEGVELRADGRVFALYALFNSLGYDAGPTVRTLPFPKTSLHPVRQKVRQQLAALDPELRKQADAFLDSHAQPLERYLAQALTAAGPKAKEPSDLKGFEGLLKLTQDQWKTDELLALVQPEYRKTLKGYLPVLDAPMTKARKLLKQDDRSRIVLVANLLEAQDRAVGVQGEGEVAIAVGPSEKPNVEAVLQEYAEVVLAPVVTAKAKGWTNGAQILREGQLAGATERSVSDYANALLARAVALKALDANDAAYEASAKTGYPVKELAQGLDGKVAVEVWVSDALERVDARKASKR